MKRVVTGCNRAIANWMARQFGGGSPFHAETGVGFAVEDGGKFRGAVWFEGFNGANMNIHITGDGTKTWLTRDFFPIIFHYAFISAGVRRLTAPIWDDNLVCRKFTEHVGFSLEATLINGTPRGNLLLYAMHKGSCHWIKGKQNVIF